MLGFENHIGKVSISDNYLTQIVRHAVTDCFGVSDVCNVDAFHSAVSALTFGKAFKNKKGVVIRTDRNGCLSIDLHIKVSYGTNISAIADSIIHKVTFTVEEAVGIKVADVNVFIDDMVG
ncbi:MAG: Asp23/Gls24 family envelope stress response protein [Ruminococcus sp.]|nr:Asp23/Gls24 family envelope stress response protein [Ruminococcus sp.]